MKPFVHLHNHTAFSLLDGAARIKDEVRRAVELGMPALAITDHGVMYGAVTFYKECQKAGIHPVIGCEVYVARRTRFDREPGKDDAPYHLILLCENEIGYRNLCKLVSAASLEGFYYRPRVDRELLALHHEGLIAMSACLGGEVPRRLMEHDESGAAEAAAWYQATFGPEHYYLELQNHGIPEQQLVNDGLARLSRQLNIPLVATNDNHYVYREDADTQDVMLCLQTGKTLSDSNRMHFEGSENYIKSYDEMLEALPAYPEALDNTVKIAERCQFDFDFSKHFMPHFETPNGESQGDYLRALCEQGVLDHYGEITSVLRERLDRELAVIGNMGYDAYFLIVWDFIDYARKNGIFVGPGRGSAAGSLVSYALGITDIDPMKYDLLFERFLNPERVNMPDIDIDFCYERRGEVIDYVARKYGEDHVAQIITFGTMAARLAVRDVGRVMEIPLSTVNKVAKLIPNELGMTLDKAMEASSELRDMMEEDPAIDHLMKTAKKLEGLPRHAGTHAAGVVISKAPMDTYLPLQKTGDGAIITQYAKEDVEDIGLLKMDFLGLRTLTVIHHTIRSIEERHGIHIDLKTLDEDDPATYEMLSRGDSLGVFQLEGQGLRAVLKDLKPTCLEDVIALVALYRPGPLGSGMVKDFIDRKHGVQDIEYLHPLLEPILSTTYGVILYQEQVMQIASRIAGFSLGEADMLRRAMGKKKPEIIESFKQQFIQGAEAHDVDRAIAESLFSLIEYFAGYGFNKSHSAAYGRLAFETAWLKCHYPAEFMAQLLNSFIDNGKKVTFYVKECRALGLPVLPPDVNTSGYDFTPTDEGIRFGLGAISGIGDHPVAAIMAARAEGGNFNDLQDFCLRVDLSQGVNKRVLENLIRCGAFGSTGYPKKGLLAVMDETVAQASALQKNKNTDQISFFDMFSDDVVEQAAPIAVPDIEDFSEAEHLQMERELLGIYVSGHPLDGVQAQLKAHHVKTIDSITEKDEGKRWTFGGILTNMRFQTTRKGDMMAYAVLEDLTGSIELLIFPRALPKLRSQLEDNTMRLVDGRLSTGDDEPKLIVDDLRPLSQDNAVSAVRGDLYIKLPAGWQMDAVLSVLGNYPGDMPVYLYFPQERRLLRLDDGYQVLNNPATLTALRNRFGVENVTIKSKHKDEA